MQRTCAILSAVACPALQYFFTLSHKRPDFLKTVTEYKICFDFLYNFHQETFLILRGIERDMIKMYVRICYNLITFFQILLVTFFIISYHVFIIIVMCFYCCVLCSFVS
jgi:hypothetical protein